MAGNSSVKNFPPAAGFIAKFCIIDRHNFFHESILHQKIFRLRRALFLPCSPTGGAGEDFLPWCPFLLIHMSYHNKVNTTYHTDLVFLCEILYHWQTQFFSQIYITPKNFAPATVYEYPPPARGEGEFTVKKRCSFHKNKYKKNYLFLWSYHLFYNFFYFLVCTPQKQLEKNTYLFLWSKHLFWCVFNPQNK